MAEINDLLSNISNIKTDIKSAIENKGQNVTNLASYPNAIENIVSGGSGGVYQYDSLENMYNDVNNRSEGDISVVYASNQSSAQPGDTLNEVTFPRKVVFDTAITSTASLSLRKTTQPKISATCRLRPTQFYISDSIRTIPRIEYTSSDGITYTRTDTYEDIYNFGGIDLESTANVNICKFFLISSIEFNGIFKYNGSNYNIVPSQLNSINGQVYNGKFFGTNGIEEGILNKTINLNLNELKNRINLYSNISNLNLNNTQNCINLFQNMKTIKTIPYIDFSQTIDASRMFASCSNLVNVPNINMSNVRLIGGMFSACNSLSNASIQNIINMCLNSNVPIENRNLQVSSNLSPFYNTKFDNSYYQNRLAELDAAGWTY